MEKLRVVLLSQFTDSYGVTEICISINGTEWKYSLNSRYACDKFTGLYNKGKYNEALSLLNHFKVDDPIVNGEKVKWENKKI